MPTSVKREHPTKRIRYVREKHAAQHLIAVHVEGHLAETQKAGFPSQFRQ